MKFPLYQNDVLFFGLFRSRCPWNLILFYAFKIDTQLSSRTTAPHFIRETKFNVTEKDNAYIYSFDPCTHSLKHISLITQKRAQVHTLAYMPLTLFRTNRFGSQTYSNRNERFNWKPPVPPFLFSLIIIGRRILCDFLPTLTFTVFGNLLHIHISPSADTIRDLYSIDLCISYLIHSSQKQC